MYRRTVGLLAVLFTTAAAVITGFAAPAMASTPVVPLSAPPMGWNSWNKFGCNVDENLIKGNVDAIVANGLDTAGYKYVNIDDCWMAPTRDSQGRLQSDPTRFPSGIASLAGYVHGKGLKLGIYESAGTATCQGLPGSLDHETTDAQTFASWGVDYLKYDNCNNQGRPAPARYKAMGDALKATGRAIVYSLCNWGQENPWIFGPNVGASLWRTTGDIFDSWGSITGVLDQQAGLEPFARQGQHNDPDILEVGNGGMTTTEYTAHFSLWSLLSAPLLLGNDLRSLNGTTKGIVSNAEVIAVNQDWGGSQGRRITQSGTSEVWAKPMSDGSVAVVLLNRGPSSVTISTSAAELGLGGSSSYSLKDLWSGATTTSTGSISASVASHGVVMYRVTRTGTLLGAPVAGTYQVGDLSWLSSSNGWGPAERNTSNGEFGAGDGRTLTLNGTTYAKGIGAHADGAVQLYLGKACPLFTAQVGVDDEVTNAVASVRFQVYGDGRLLAYTDVKTASQGATALSVPTAGYATLELRVTDARDGNNSDHADWGAATLTCSSPTTGSSASDRAWSSASNGWGPAERDQSNGEVAAGDGVVASVGGVNYVKAVGAHAAGDVAIALGGSCTRFTSVVGVDGESPFSAASVVFSVVADGVTLYSSPTLRGGGGSAVVDVDVTGRSTLHLVVSDAGDGNTYDHATWGGARLACTPAAAPNTLPNGDAEAGATVPAGWSHGGWQPQDSMFVWDTTSPHTGARSLSINAGATANDLWWTQTVNVPPPPIGSPGHTYRLSGWIKTDGVNGGAGAQLGTLDSFAHTAGISGTTDWTPVSIPVRPNADSQLRITARLGFYGGTSTGRAWFDDLQLVDVTPTPSTVPPSWKILALVYPTTDFTAVDGHHYAGTMSNADRDNAITSVTQFANQDIPALDSGYMVPQITVRVPARPLALAPIGDPGFYWPDGNVTAPERDPAFDSVIVIWNAHVVDETGQTRNINNACGLTPAQGTNQTYSTVPVSSVSCIGGTTNVFKHEWGHSILFYHDSLGVSPTPAVNNHINVNQPDTHYVHCPTGAEYDLYDANGMEKPPTVPNSAYNIQTGFTHDYYSGTTALAANPGQCLGIPPSAWAYGGPKTVGGQP
ncbi:MAG: NPCBM/NEW2 domain-containing protein [Pseudonocardiaceae bacterium]